MLLSVANSPPQNGSALPSGEPKGSKHIMQFRKSVLSAVAALFLTTSAAKAGEMASADIVDTAVSAGQFETLVAAVKAAGLVETLKGDGPFTVFAPTDEAFAKLPAGTIETLLKPENKDQLVSILTYHVVPGKVMARDVIAKRTRAATVQGGEVVIDGVAGVFVNSHAQVVAADIEASNGVIHVVEEVILPR